MSTKYIKAYFNICNNARKDNRSKKDGIYYENHHIKPTSLGGLDINTNKVLLTGREHYIVHFLLYKHYKSINKQPGLAKMAKAFNMMTLTQVRKERYTSKTFEIARIASAEAQSYFMKGKPSWNTGLDMKSLGYVSANLNIPIPQEVKDKISNTLMGNTPWNKDRTDLPSHSSESNLQRSKTMKGQNTGNQKIITCPHCNKSGGNTMKRWHFDHCKYK